MIQIHQLNKSFGNLHVLKDLSVCFERGQSIAIMGPNASGKTTLIKCILDIVHPDSGQIRVNGQDTRTGRDYLRQVGYMSQIGRYPDHMRVGQVLDLMKKIRASVDQPTWDEELVHTYELPAIYKKAMYSLSGGTRQKLGAALAFLFDPDILILDEPMAGLDLIARQQLKMKIRQAMDRQKLILISSHLLTDLEEIVSHIFYMEEGKQQFFYSTEDMHQITGEASLAKGILGILQQSDTQALSGITA